MQDKLRAIEEHYEAITEEMGQPDVLTDHLKLQALAKERAALEKVVSIYRELRGVEEQIEEARGLVNGRDAEMADLAQEELETLGPRKEQLDTELKVALLPPDPHDDRNVIVEIRGGTGGEEAALFAADLFRMYSRYAERKRWPLEVISSNGSEKGGFKEIVFEVHGHGRLFTLQVRERRASGPACAGDRGAGPSCTPAPPPSPCCPKPTRSRSISTRRTSGRTSSIPAAPADRTSTRWRRRCASRTSPPARRAVPGRALAAQEPARKHGNVLRARLLAMKEAEQAEEIASSRKSQVGSGDRSDHIRTYNFPQDRITDHRIGYTRHGLPQFMDGDIDDLIDAVATAEQARRLEESLD